MTDGTNPTKTPAITQHKINETSVRVRDDEPDAVERCPQRTGTQTRTRAMGTRRSIMTQKAKSCHIETVERCAININFNEKILVPGNPSVISKMTQAQRASTGDDHHTPLTLNDDLDEYRL